MKFNLNTPLPQSLPKECTKAAKILQSFVDTQNQGLDGVIPRHVLQRAHGFAIFSVFKAGFVFSARAGSGIVIARLPDGSWSSPSAIGTAGMGFGGQAGAEVTDFLIILNSPSAVRSFMSAGSLTLGGNMSIAVGPLGRNGEASGSLGTSGTVATMYSYSKTKGLFGGVSVEGSVIVERQDANALAYGSDVTAKVLLSGAISPPEWSMGLIWTLENCTGLPGGRKWVNDGNGGQGYAFGGVASPGSEAARRKKSRSISSFPPASWGKSKDGGSYFTPTPEVNETGQAHPAIDGPANFESNLHDFPTRFESDFMPDTSYAPSNTKPVSSLLDEPAPSYTPRSPHTRSQSHSHQMFHSSNPFLQPQSYAGRNPFSSSSSLTSGDKPLSTQKAVLGAPLQPHEGVARAIALFDFKAVESGDLPFSKGDIIIVTEKSERTDDWWTGVLNGKQGIFPANFVEIV